jgi:hypothetical protein
MTEVKGEDRRRDAEGADLKASAFNNDPLPDLGRQSRPAGQLIAELFGRMRFVVVGGELLSPDSAVSAGLEAVCDELSSELENFQAQGLTHIAVLASETMQAEIDAIDPSHALTAAARREDLHCSDRTAQLIILAKSYGLGIILLNADDRMSAEFRPEDFNARTSAMAQKLQALPPEAKALVVTINDDTATLPVELPGGQVLMPLAAALAQHNSGRVAGVRFVGENDNPRARSVLNSAAYESYLEPGKVYAVENEFPISGFLCGGNRLALCASHILFRGGRRNARSED